MKIGFVGLGQMGRNMAARLIERGHTLTVWNRTIAAAETLRERGARVAAAAGETLDSEIVVTMLADDAAIESVWIASGLYATLPRETIHLNMATAGLALAERLATLHA